MTKCMYPLYKILLDNWTKLVLECSEVKKPKNDHRDEKNLREKGRPQL